MKKGLVTTAGLLIASLGISTAATAQSWGPPPPPPPYGYAPPPPPPRYWRPAYAYGYYPAPRHHRHCWTEYRHHGWERVRVCT